jgi:hypothetical protein
MGRGQCAQGAYDGERILRLAAPNQDVCQQQPVFQIIRQEREQGLIHLNGVRAI